MLTAIQANVYKFILVHRCEPVPAFILHRYKQSEIDAALKELIDGGYVGVGKDGEYVTLKKIDGTERK